MGRRTRRDRGRTVGRWSAASAAAVVIAIVVSTALVVSPMNATTVTRTSATEAVLTHAVGSAGGERVAPSPGLSIPRTGGGTVALGTDRGSLTLTLPGRGGSTTHRDTQIFGERGDQVAVQPVAQGFRALVVISGPQSPERFAFELGGVTGSVELTDDGGAVVHDRTGTPVAVVAAPWARDATGAPVPTRYEVDGTTLTQVVEHRGGRWAYPIVADPTVWKLTKCAAAIGVAVGSAIFAAAKIAKIRKLIRVAGGLRKTARRVIKGLKKKGSVSTKARAAFGDLGKGAVAAAIVILDIDEIQDQCG